MPAAKQSFGGTWTVEKLERIRKYLAAYVQILKGQTSWCEAFSYIDAFAGTGYNSRRSTANGESTDPELLSEVAADDNQKFLDGSARIALQIEPSFTSYHFIEKSTARARELEKLKAEFPQLSERIFVTSGDANEQIQQFCRTWDWSKRRAVLFLDPFGMQVSWTTIVAIARTGAIDMWLLFPAGIGVNRMLPRHGDIPAAWRRRLCHS